MAEKTSFRDYMNLPKKTCSMSARAETKSPSARILLCLVAVYLVVLLWFITRNVHEVDFGIFSVVNFIYFFIFKQYKNLFFLTSWVIWSRQMLALVSCLHNITARSPCWESFLEYTFLGPTQGFPGGAGDKEPTCQCRRHTRRRFNTCVGKIHWKRKLQPTQVFLPGESHGQGSLAGYSPWGCRESDMAEAT